MKLPFVFVRQPTWKGQTRLWLQSIAHVLDAATLFFSFGFLVPGFVLRCARWRMRKSIDETPVQILRRVN